MNFADFVSLVQAIAWPAVVVAVVLVFRQELPRLIRALSGRISSLTAVGVTLEFAAAEPAAETLRVLDQIKEPSSTGPPPPSGIPSLLELAKSSRPADYLVIDLRDGLAWLTSRLYLFAVVLPPVLGLRRFVFVGTRNSVPRYFLGLVSPDSIARALERRYPWLHTAMVAAQLQPLVTGQNANPCVSWRPYGDTEAAVKRLIQGSARADWDITKAEALAEIVRALVNPIDLFQPGQIELFVNRFLENPELRRPHNVTALDEDWVRVDTVDEHARWIKDERQLLDLIGAEFRRDQVVVNTTAEDDVLQKAVLRKRGDFVAVTDPEGRFNQVIDRIALVERVATGKHD